MATQLFPVVFALKLFDQLRVYQTPVVLSSKPHNQQQCYPLAVLFVNRERPTAVFLLPVVFAPKAPSS